MVMLMRKLGYEIQVANNGQEVLLLLEREALRGPEFEIQCILMDVTMDVMDGIECTRLIRERQQLTRLRPFIIAQTANVSEVYRRNCLEAGMDMFTCKVSDACDCHQITHATEMHVHLFCVCVCVCVCVIFSQ
jgi:CheY-like chemotaxis protein